MNKDRIAIILSTYNGEKYIAEQLNAVRNQTHKNWRCYIRDDGSKDNSIAILKDFASIDERIVFLDDKQGNMGLNTSHYYLLAIPTEEYIATCDQDDVWHERKLEASLAKLKIIETPQKIPALVHTDSIVVDSQLNVIYPRFIGKRGFREDLSGILFANSVQGGSILMNNSLRDIAIKVPTILPYDYHIGIISNLIGVRGFVPETLLKYRQHSASSIASGNTKEANNTNSVLNMSLRLSLSNYHHIKNDFSTLPTSPKAKNQLKDYFYLFEGKSLLKKCWLIAKHNYPFYSKKDFVKFFWLVIKNKNLLDLI